MRQTTSFPCRQRSAALLTLLLWCLLTAVPAWGGVRDAAGHDLQVALVTYGPGAIYWERFGHDAIEIRDTVSGQNIHFNYGVFDFNQKNFLLNFARGRMNYIMDAERGAAEIDGYLGQRRSVRRQVLALTPSQATQLRDFLFRNLRPENRHYRYDYYTNNCTTKIRDVLDRVLGGQLKKQFSAHAGSQTYRQQSDRLMANQPWLMLLLDLGLSHYADRPLDSWQESFLPVVLAREVANARIDDASGGTQPLLATDTMLATNHLMPPPRTPPDLRPPLLLAGAAFGTLLVLCGRSRHRVARIAFGALASLWLLLAGLAGLFMLALWALTTHHAGWANANLLLFNPFAWLLLACVWRLRVTPRAHLIAWSLLGLSALALAGNLTGLLSQRNLPWIFLALPVWLALAHTLHRRSTASAPESSV